jgi:hypothetical protein
MFTRHALDDPTKQEIVAAVAPWMWLVDSDCKFSDLVPSTHAPTSHAQPLTVPISRDTSS